MKKFIFIIFSVLIIFIHVVDAYSIPKGILTIETNILNTTTFEVSLYLQRTVDSDFWKLGGSSFVFNFNRNALVFNSISDIGNWGVPPYQAPFSSEYTKYPWRTFETLLYTVNGGTEVPLTKTLLAKLQFTITNPLMNHQVFWIGSPYSAVFTDNLETEVTDNLTIVNPVDAPLPVSLSSFNSSVNKNAVNLKWKTAQEVNNKEFQVERKFEMAADWTKTATVQGKGNSSVPVEYSFIDRNLSSGKYSYRLKQIDNNGNFEYFNLSGDVIVGVPAKFDLSQNYPNPFNPATKVNFDLPKDGLVSLKIFDMLGREVSTLVNEIRKAGYYTVEFNASNLASGVYFYRISAGEFSSVKKMIILK